MTSQEYSSLEPAFGYIPTFRAPEINHEATNYMSDHMAEIKRALPKMGVCNEKLEDLYSDVFLSLMEGELVGKGYSVDKCNINVEQFVYGRLSRYSKNVKYSTVYTEVKSGHYCFAATAIDDEDNLTSFQAQYKNISVSDEMDIVDTELSVEDALETCLDFAYGTEIKVVAIFKNVEELDLEARGKRSSHCKDGSSVFSEINKIAVWHPEFLEAFTTAMLFRSRNLDKFLEILDRVMIHNSIPAIA